MIYEIVSSFELNFFVILIKMSILWFFRRIVVEIDDSSSTYLNLNMNIFQHDVQWKSFFVDFVNANKSTFKIKEHFD
jgi:hypothetical protein